MANHPPAAPSALPQYLIAFPDFGELDIALPDGSKDISWKNNTCPSFVVKRFSDGTSLVLYVDYQNMRDREVEGGKQFMLQLNHGDGEPGKVVVSTDDYQQVLHEVANDIPPLQRPDERLVEFDAGAGATAWRVTEPEAAGLFALVYAKTGTLMAIPSDPENGPLVFTVFDEEGGHPSVTVELAGRADLNSFYESHVGYAPDQEPGGPIPIQELIADIAAKMLLRVATDPRI